jgi:hypothetical protein
MHDDAQNKRTTKTKKGIFLGRYSKLLVLALLLLVRAAPPCHLLQLSGIKSLDLICWMVCVAVRTWCSPGCFGSGRMTMFTLS